MANGAGSMNMWCWKCCTWRLWTGWAFYCPLHNTPTEEKASA